MSELDRKICRYFNTLGGCWYGEECKFMHVLNKKPPCKFFSSSYGCRYGESCHFSHENSLLTSDESCDIQFDGELKGNFKEDRNPNELIDRNNNNANESSTSSDVHGNSNINNEATFGELGAAKVNLSYKDIHCGSCKRSLNKPPNVSYCDILKDHYLTCFWEKSGEHIKHVKIRAAFELGQMYWCKACILVYDKPWSLFQHMTDKAKGPNVPNWEKKHHAEWLDSMACLMAGYDLGLFSLKKIKSDFRHLMADEITAEEEMEAVARSAKFTMQLYNPTGLMPQVNSASIGNPWRLHQREMMQRVEQLNEQMLQKGAKGLNWDNITGMVHNTLKRNSYGSPNKNHAARMVHKTTNKFMQAANNIQAARMIPSTFYSNVQGANITQATRMVPSTSNSNIQAFSNILASRMAPIICNSYAQTIDNGQATEMVPITSYSNIQATKDAEVTEMMNSYSNGNLQTFDNKKATELEPSTSNDNIQDASDADATAMVPDTSNGNIQVVNDADVAEIVPNTSNGNIQAVNDTYATEMAPSTSNIQVTINESNVNAN